jgi:hypothetical protein
MDFLRNLKTFFEYNSDRRKYTDYSLRPKTKGDSNNSYKHKHILEDTSHAMEHH